MLPKYHFVLGIIFSVALFLIFPSITLIEAGIIFLSTFFIDVDHYIYYFFKKKDTSLKNAINHFMEERRKVFQMKKNERKKFYSGFCFLHGIEIVIILFLLGIFLSKYFLFAAIGIMFHLFLDITEEIYLGGRLDKISVCYDWFKFKDLRHL